MKRCKTNKNNSKKFFVFIVEEKPSSGNQTTEDYRQRARSGSNTPVSTLLACTEFGLFLDMEDRNGVTYREHLDHAGVSYINTEEKLVEMLSDMQHKLWGRV